MIIHRKAKKSFCKLVLLVTIMAFPAVTHAQAETLLSLYRLAGIDCFSENTEAVIPRCYRDQFAQALDSDQGKQVMSLIADRGFSLGDGQMLALSLPGGGLYAAVPLYSKHHMQALTSRDEELQQSEGYEVFTFLSYKSSETHHSSFCFIEVLEHRKMGSKSKIRWVFPEGGGYELTMENYLPRIRPVSLESELAIIPAATYDICEQLYNLFVELITIGLILVEAGYIGLFTVITVPLGIFFLGAAVVFDFFGYLVLGLDIACFIIQSILQFFS